MVFPNKIYDCIYTHIFGSFSFPLLQDRTSNYVDYMREAFRLLEYNMVMAVLRAARADTYASIKKLTYHESGIPSQVITGRKLKGQQAELKSIATKVMIQIAAKLGAEPWQVSVPQTVSPWFCFLNQSKKKFTQYFELAKLCVDM